MIDNFPNVKGISKNDKFVLTLSIIKDGKVNTECHINNFPTSDLQIAQRDVSALIQETFVRDSKPKPKTDEQIAEAVNNEVKDLING